MGKLRTLINLFIIWSLWIPSFAFSKIEFSSCGFYDMSGRLKLDENSFSLVLNEGTVSRTTIPLIVNEAMSKELRSIGLNSFKGVFRVSLGKMGAEPGKSELISYKSRKNPGAPDQYVLVQGRSCQ